MQGDEFASECDDSIAFFDQLRSDYRLHRHPGTMDNAVRIEPPQLRKSGT